MVQNFQIHSESKWSRVVRDSTLRNNSTLTQMHLTYGSEHKTERFRSIEVIVLGAGGNWQNWCFLPKTVCSLRKVVKEIFQYPSFYDFYFFLGVQKIKSLHQFGPGSSVIDAGGS
jgi:hypothetical protein